MTPTKEQAMRQLVAIIQATGLTVNDYALHIIGCHPSRLYALGLSGGGATPVTWNDR